jgi:hypothetical protein
MDNIFNVPFFHLENDLKRKLNIAAWIKADPILCTDHLFTKATTRFGTHDILAISQDSLEDLVHMLARHDIRASNGFQPVVYMYHILDFRSPLEPFHLLLLRAEVAHRNAAAPIFIMNGPYDVEDVIETALCY